MGYHVDSEVGRLRRVLLHRPGVELDRLTPRNRAELLFDDVLWADRARQDHDELATVLRDHGVDVWYLGDLLAETLEDDVARKWVLEHTANEHELGPVLAPAVYDALAAMGPAALARALVGGVTVDEVAGGHGLAWSVLAPSDPVLPPLPNHLYTRDASCWIYGGVTVNPMAKRARRRERVHVEAIYRFHPAFAHAPFEAWIGDVDREWGRATLEGGDVLVVGNGAVLVGMGERTTPYAVEHLAQRLFAREAARELVVVALPVSRSYMHLDAVMTMVDVGTFLVYPGVVDDARVWALTPGDAPGELVVTRRADVFAALADALDVDALRVLRTAGDAGEADREQWDDGINVLALAPGLVVAYDRNAGTNAALRRAGIDVVTVSGSELSRGRGGPRCMTCPLVREAG